MSNTIKLIFTLADIHSGSSVALMPPVFTTAEGQSVIQNKLQEWIWRCWIDSGQWIESIARGDPYALVLNGDIIEGVHHKTTQIISADVGDHIKCAKEVLRPVTKRAKKIFMVKGTECHTGTSENFIAEGLGAEENTAEGTHSWDRLTIDVNGVRCVWRHHIGTSVRRSLAATQLSATLAEEQVEAANAGEPIPRVVCCAHRHKFGYYEDNNGLCVVSPPWQGLSRFGHKVVSQARTNPGVFALDFRGKNRGELPELHSRVYESQRTQAVEL